MGLTGSKLAVGLVIRAKEVELLAVQGSDIAARVRVPIEGSEPAQLTKAIQAALSASALKTRRMAVAIPTQDVLIRFFTMPAVPKPEWETAVQFEARKYIPFKMDTLTWDFCVMPSTAAKQLEVIFSAIPKELFLKTLEAIAAAGIQPLAVEPRSVSLARLVTPSARGKPDELSCLVDISQESAHLAIVKNHLPYLTRDLNLLLSGPQRPGDPGGMSPAGSRQESAPAAPSGLTPGAGEAAPSAPEGEGAAGAIPAEAMDPRAHRLLSELNVSIDFFLREHPATTISRVYLFGDETVISPWCRWLADQLHRPVELGTSLLDPRLQGRVSLSFASAAGLLLAAKGAGKSSVDFLRRTQTKAPAAPLAGLQSNISLGQLTEALRGPGAMQLLKSPSTAAGAVAMLCLLMAWWFLGNLNVAAIRQRISQLVTAAPPDGGLGLNQMTQGDLDALKGQAAEQLSLVTQLMDRRTRVAGKLDALARSIPEGIWLTSLTFEDRLAPTGQSQLSLALSGSCFLGDPARELNAIHTFEQEAKRNPAFSSGFASTQLDQIHVRVYEEYTYRAFLMNCSSDRRL